MPNYRNLNDPEVSNFLARVAAGQTGQDPRAQTLARSANNPDAQAQGQAMLEQQARQQAQAAQDAQKAAAQAQKDAAKEAERQRKIQVRAGEAAGMQTETDIISGKKTIKTDPATQAPLWKPGPVGKPRVAPAVNDALGTVPGLGDVVTSGALGVPTPYQPAGNQAVVQDWRNPKGQTITTPLPTKTDPNTGLVTVETKNDFGAPIETTVGIDREREATAQKDAELEARRTKIAVQRNTLEQTRAKFDPLWKPAKKAADEAGAELNRFDKSPKFMRGPNGEWAYRNPDTDLPKTVNADEHPAGLVHRGKVLEPGSTYPVDPDELAKWQRDRAYLQKVNESAQAEARKYAPQAEQLDAAEARLKDEHLRLEMETIRHKAGLPAEDGGAAETLAAAATGTTTPTADLFDELTKPRTTEQPSTATEQGPAATSEQPAATGSQTAPQASQEPTTAKETATQPLVPLSAMDDPAKKQAVQSVVRGIKEPDKINVQSAPDGTATLMRGKDSIAYVQRDRTGNPMIILSGGAEAANLRHQVDFSATSGVPVYLQQAPGTESADPVKDAQYAAQVFGAVRNVTANRDQFATPEEAATEVKRQMQSLQATPDQVVERVRSGRLSVQTGESILKEVWGLSLQHDDPTDPKAFDAWLAKQPAVTRDSWAQAKNVEEKDEVRAWFLRDWWQRNSWRPGVDEAAYKDAAAKVMPGRQAEGSWAAMGRSLATNIIPAVGASIGASFGAGLGMALGLESGPGAAATNVAGNIAGAATGKYIASTLQHGFLHYVFDEDWIRENKAQIEANSQKHYGSPSQFMGDIVPVLVECIGNPAGGFVAMSEGKVIGRMFTRGGQVALEDMSKIQRIASEARAMGDLATEAKLLRKMPTPPWYEHVAANSVMGARIGFADSLNRKIEGQVGPDGEPLTGLDVLNETLRSAVTMGSMGFAPEAILLKPAAEAVIPMRIIGGARNTAAMLVSGTLYDALTQWKKPDWTPVTQEFFPTATAFVAQELVMAAFHRTWTGRRDFSRLQRSIDPLGDPTLTPPGKIHMTEADKVAAETRPEKIAGMVDEDYQSWLQANTTPDRPTLQDMAGIERASIAIQAARLRGDNATVEALDRQMRESTQRTDYTADELGLDAEEDAKILNDACDAFNKRLATAREFLGLDSAPAPGAGSVPPMIAAPEADTPPANAHKWAGMEAGIYAAAPAPPEGKPTIKDAVNEAFTTGQAVHASMLRHTTAKPPANYERVGNYWQPKAEGSTEAPPAGSAKEPTATPPATTPAKPAHTEPTINHAMAIAVRVKKRVEQEMPKTKGRIKIDAKTEAGSGGATVDKATGTMTIHARDIQRMAGSYDRAAIEDFVTHTAKTHETGHIVQTEALKRIWQDGGSKGRFEEFYDSWYDQMGKELSPETIAKARDLYGHRAWDALADKAAPGKVTANQAAEIARMLLEAKLNPTSETAEKVSELHRALKIDASPSLLKTIRAAVDAFIRMVKTGELPASWKDHIDKLEELYRELAEPEKPAEPKPDEPAGKPPEGGKTETTTKPDETAVPPAEKPAEETPPPAEKPPSAGEAGDKTTPDRTTPPDEPGGKPGETKPPEGTGKYRIEDNPDGTKRILEDGKVIGDNLSEAGAKQLLENLNRNEGSPLQVIGQAISAARAQFDKDLPKERFAELREATDDLVETMAGMPRDEWRPWIDKIIADHLKPEIEAQAKDRAKTAEQKAKEEQRQKAATDAAHKLIQRKAPTIAAILRRGKIAPPARNLGLINSAAKRRKLTEREMEIRRNASDWDGMPKKQDYPGKGVNIAIRRILDMITAAPGEGLAPNVMADKLTESITTASDMAEQIKRELHAMSRAKDTPLEYRALEDPDYEYTPEEEAELARIANKRAAEAAEEQRKEWEQSEEGKAAKAEEAKRKEAEEAQERAEAAAREHVERQTKHLKQRLGVDVRPDQATAVFAKLARLMRTEPKTRNQEEADAQLRRAAAGIVNTNPTGNQDSSVFHAIEQNHALNTTADKGIINRVKRWVKSMPAFQGGKQPMAEPVTQALHTEMSQEARDHYTVGVDYFGGGGNWGIFHALTNFRNMKRMVIYERNADRLEKIRMMHEKGRSFGAILQSPPIQKLIQEAIRQADMDGTPSGTAIAARINKTGITNKDHLGVLQALQDRLEHSRGTQKDDTDTKSAAAKIQKVLKSLAQQAAEAQDAADAFKKRAGNENAIEYRNEDSYKAQPDQGSHVMAFVDPPYYLTKGYSVSETEVDLLGHAKEKKTTETKVGEDTYGKTRDLLGRLAKAGNGFIYTDSAWWKKSSVDDFVPYDQITDPREQRAYFSEGRKILTDIAGLADRFDVVSPEIGGRKEVLGIHYGNQTNTDTGGSTGPGSTTRETSPQGDVDRRVHQPAGGALPDHETVGGMAPGTAGENGALRGERHDPLNPGQPEGAGGEPPGGSRPTDANEDLPPWLREKKPGNRRTLGSSSPVAEEEDIDLLHAVRAMAAQQQPIDRQKPFRGWSAPKDSPFTLTGYRGESKPSTPEADADNGFGSSEGIGLYVARNEDDAFFFGPARKVNFPLPEKPLVVDEDGTGEPIPMLDEENAVWSHIWSHKESPTDSDWIKAHVRAAKKIGLTEDTWVEKIDDLPRALTDEMLAMGYDAVYVRSGGMEWANILARPGQRYNRGARDERGNVLYSSAPELEDLRQTSSAKDVLDRLGKTRLIPTSVAAAALGGDRPQYLDATIHHIMSTRKRLVEGKLTRREVAKAYILTQGSIGSDARPLTTINARMRALGRPEIPASFADRDRNGNLVLRPEHMTAWWLLTPNGKKALDALERGVVDGPAFEDLARMRQQYGKNNFVGNSVVGQMRRYGKNAPEGKAAQSIAGIEYGQKPQRGRFNLANLDELTDAINATRGDTGKMMAILSKTNGISEGKKGFIGALMGVGNLPTVDAVEMNFWLTGKGSITGENNRAADMVRAIGKNLGDTRVRKEITRRITKRVRDLRQQGNESWNMPDEVAGAIIHHMLWDTAKGIETSHHQMYKAMRLAASAPELADQQESRIVRFDDPMTGPSGARLVAYDWKNDAKAVPDMFGEDQAQRKSNWSRSLVNHQTGRGIVHQFHVRMPDGSERVMSMESALRAMGYTLQNGKKAAPFKMLAGMLRERAKLGLEAQEMAAGQAADPSTTRSDRLRLEELRARIATLDERIRGQAAGGAGSEKPASPDLFDGGGQPDVAAAAAAPNAREILGDVRVGTMNALGAYRTLTAKRERTGSLTGEEEQKLLAAEQALGQKMAFDMEAVKSRRQQSDMGRMVESSGQMRLLSSAPERMADPSQLELEFGKEPDSHLFDMRDVDTQMPEHARKSAFTKIYETIKSWTKSVYDSEPAYFDFAEKHIGSGDEASAALRAFLSGGFTKINAKPDHEVTKAVDRAVSVFPVRRPKRIMRMLGFKSAAEAERYVANMKNGKVVSQKNPFASWAEATDQWEDSAGEDLPEMMAGQFGNHFVTIRVENPPPANDVSAAYPGARITDTGVELITKSGTQLQVKQIVKYNGNWIVTMEGVERKRRNTSQRSLFSSAPEIDDPNQGFHSHLEQVIRDKAQKLSTPEQIMGLMKNNGVKEEEIKWSGIVPKMQELAAANGGKVPKQAVEEHLANEGRVRFVEVQYDGDMNKTVERWMRRDGVTLVKPEKPEDPDFPWELRDSKGEIIDVYETRHEAIQTIYDNSDRDDGEERRYSQYQLPGGENYRETVLAMPDESYGAAWARWAKQNGREDIGSESDFQKATGRKPNDGKTGYTSSHFPDVPNYVAHMRTNERTDSTGEPGLFIEELQSDRHQAGKKRGYKSDVLLTPDEMARYSDLILEGKPASQHTPEERELIDRGNKATSDTGMIPDAPYRQSSAWGLALFKRALRDAVASGKKWIGWTTGDTQAERYDLSKQIKEVAFYWNPGEKTGQLVAIDTNGQSAINERNVAPDKLEDYVGKEVAQRIMEEKGVEGVRVLRGLQLKVGGEGMKGFYDGIMPHEIRRYVSQWKAKVERGKLKSSGEMRVERDGESFAVVANDGSVHGRYDTEQKAQDRIDSIGGEKDGTTIWRVEITPEMRKGVEKGQTLFSSAPEADDARYMELAKDPEKNRDELQRMVDDRSRQSLGDPHSLLMEPNGDRKIMYHGSAWGDHDVFSLLGTPNGKTIRPERIGRGIDKLGFWFTSSRNQADEYSSVPGRGKGKTYSTYLDIRNPLILNSVNEWNDWVSRYAIFHGNDADMEIALEKGKRDPSGWFNADKVRERLRAGKKDGIIIIDSDLDGRFGLKDGEDLPTWAIALYPSQIKSADPITRDADGNIIPLSQRFNQDSNSILYSSAPDMESREMAVREALRRMPPIYRDVFEAVSNGASVEDMMRKHGKSAKAIANILDQVRSRVQTAISSASEEGLKPVMRGEKILGGRPDLAFGADKEFAAIDQLRNESGIPNRRGREEVIDTARRMLEDDYEGTYERMLDASRNMRQMTDTEVAATKMIIARETLAGRAQSPEDRVKVAMLIHGYRDIGTETARSLAMRYDPNLKPAERHALAIAEVLYEPDASIRKMLRKASPKDSEEIMRKWMGRVDRIKEELIAQGIDIDASMRAFHEAQTEVKETEAENPVMKKAVDEAYRKLSAAEKIVIDALRNSEATYEIAANYVGYSEKDVKEMYEQFYSDVLATMDAAAARHIQAALAASPPDARDEIMARFGFRRPDSIPDNEAHRARIEAERQRKEQPETPRAKRPGGRAKPATPGTPKEPRPPKAPATDSNQVTMPMEGAADGSTDRTGIFPGRIHGQDQEIPASVVLKDKNANWHARFTTLEDGTMLERRTDKNGKVKWIVRSGVIDMKDPVQVKRVLDAFGVAKGGWSDKTLEWWRMSVLTGPQTQIVNAASHAAHAVWNAIPRRVVEATVNRALALAGQNAKNAATFGEFIPMAKALAIGFKNASKAATMSWNLGGIRVFQNYMQARAMDLQSMGVGGEYIPPALQGKIANVMRSLSFRAMSAADEYIKAVYGTIETAAQAHRIAAVREGLTGAAYEERMYELMQPKSEASLIAMDNTLRVGFQEEINGTNPRSIHRADQLAAKIKSLRAEPYIGKPISYVIPFVDTPLNLAKLGFELTPLNGILIATDMLRSLKRRIVRGDIPKDLAIKQANEIYDRLRLVQDITNQTIAWAAFLTVKAMVSDDNDEHLPMITGTMPYTATKRGERDNARNVMPPMTIRLGGLQFSYSRFDPFAVSLATAADLALANQQHGGFGLESAGETAAKFKDQMKDKTFMFGLTNLINASENPEKFLKTQAGGVITGFVPNIIRQPMREADPAIRETRPLASDGFFTSMARTVGYSIVPQLAPQKTDVWGKPIQANKGWRVGGNPATDAAFRIFDPTNAQIMPDIDPIDRWIFRWNHQAAEESDRIGIQPIGDTVSVTDPLTGKSTKVPLTPEERDQANVAAGQAARKALGEGWDSKPLNAANAKIITKVVEQFQTVQRKMLATRKLVEKVNTPATHP